MTHHTRRTLIAACIPFVIVGMLESAVRTLPDPGGRAARFSEYAAPVTDWRRVVGQPATYTHTVYLFGSSTMYDLATRDDETIASRLQAALPDTRVVNAAQVGGGVRAALARLKTVDLQAGDSVIFYLGTGDSLGLYSLAIKRREQQYSGCMWLLDNLFTLALVQQGCQWVSWTFPAELANPARLQQLAGDMAADYHAALREAYRYTTAHRAAFLHIVEPNIFTIPPQTPQEQTIVNSWYLGRDGFGRVFAVTLPLLTVINDVPTLDLTHALDDARQAGVNVYADCCHLNAAGDKVIAASLVTVLAHNGKEDTP